MIDCIDFEQFGYALLNRARQQALTNLVNDTLTCCYSCSLNRSQRLVTFNNGDLAQNAHSDLPNIKQKRLKSQEVKLTSLASLCSAIGTSSLLQLLTPSASMYTLNCRARRSRAVWVTHIWDSMPTIITSEPCGSTASISGTHIENKLLSTSAVSFVSRDICPTSSTVGPRALRLWVVA